MPSKSRSSRRRSKSRRRSRSRVRIPITHEGSLTALGYHLKDSAEKRRAALKRALKNKKVRYASLMGKLNVLVVFNKNKDKALARKVEGDVKYMKKKLRPIYSKSARRRSRSASKRKSKSRRRSRKRRSKRRSTRWLRMRSRK